MTSGGDHLIPGLAADGAGIAHGAAFRAGGGGEDGALVPGVAGGGDGLDIGDGIAPGAVDGLAAVLSAGGSLIHGVVILPGVTGGGDHLVPGLAADGAGVAHGAAFCAGGRGEDSALVPGVTSGGNHLIPGLAADGAGIAHGAAFRAGGGGEDGALVPGVAGGGDGLDIGDGIAPGAVDGLAAVLGAGGSLIHGVVILPGVAGGIDAPGLGIAADGAGALLTAALGAGGRGDGGPGAKGVAGGGDGFGIAVAAHGTGIGAHTIHGASGLRGDRGHIVVGQHRYLSLGHDHRVAHGAVTAFREAGVGAGGGNGRIDDNGVAGGGDGLGPGRPTQLAGVGAHPVLGAGGLSGDYTVIPLVLTGGLGDGDRAGDGLARHGGGEGGAARPQGGELVALHLHHIAACRHSPAGLHVHVDLRGVRPGVVGGQGSGHGGQICLLSSRQRQGGDGVQGDAADGVGRHPDVHGGIGGGGGLRGVGGCRGAKLLDPEIHPAVYHMGNADGGHVLGEHVAAVTLAGIVLVVLPPALKDILGGGVANGNVLRCAVVIDAKLPECGIPASTVRADVTIRHHDFRGPLHGYFLQVVVVDEVLELTGYIGFGGIVLVPVPGIVAGTEVVDHRQHVPGVGLGIGDIQLDVDVSAGGRDGGGAGEHKHSAQRQSKTSANQLFHG